MPLAGETGCAVNQPESCPYSVVLPIMLDSAVIRRVFGEPKEVIECSGIGLMHYDPPLSFDFSQHKHPYLAPMARW